jgi:LuxR family maltose regulon positive regulatory protein
MAAPLLKTKLYIPPPRPELVSRPRLMERLNAGLDRKLTLVSAPAGFGKTTLVSAWIAGCEPRMRAAWLSLDKGDNDPTRFLAYLVAALQAGLQTIAPRQSSVGNAGEGLLGLLDAAQTQPTPTESILTALLNELTTIPDRFALVLDDYHVIESKPVDSALIFLLEHMSPPAQGGLHLVIATREDPQLPLARLRVRGQLTELREADLRFTPSEAADFFNQLMDLNLTADEIAALETRTEGWIAGLQMAALALQGTFSIQGRADTASFIQAFTGSHRFVMDYLVEEILQQQPEHVRSFLLQTSVLDRLCGPLCDAVRFGFSEQLGDGKSPSSSDGTAAVQFGFSEQLGDAKLPGQKNGREMLKALDRDNLFVIPLDDKRQWYRYHRLFADVLHANLMDDQPNQVPTLHRRASAWYEQNGLPADAVHHALAAGDDSRAASLIELAWPEMESSYQFATWLGWVEALPDELVCARPVLSVDYGKALLLGGELEAGEARLRDAERWLEGVADVRERPEAPSAETCPEQPAPSLSRGGQRMVVVAEERFRSLPVSIATARAYHAQALGRVSETIKYARHCQRAISGAPVQPHIWGSPPGRVETWKLPIRRLPTVGPASRWLAVLLMQWV